MLRVNEDTCWLKLERRSWLGDPRGCLNWFEEVALYAVVGHVQYGQCSKSPFSSVSTFVLVQRNGRINTSSNSKFVGRSRRRP